MNNIGTIISREFTERICKKSFIITTIFTPLLMIALGVAPSLMMLHNTGDVKHIVVVDDTEGAIVGKALQPSSTVDFQLLDNLSRSEATMRFSDKDNTFGILWIGHDIMDNPDQVQLMTNSSSSIMIEEEIERQISDILRTAKLSSFDIENLDNILAESDIKVSLSTMKNNGTGDESSMEHTSAGLSSGLSMLLGLMLYFFILIYGQQVLTSVIEEKQSRVLDVMVTSCKPFDMMMGKILGIAAIAAVQVAIWCVLVSGASIFLTPLIHDAIADSTATAATAVGTLADISSILKMFLCMLLYIVGGFLLYASLYAAIGSAVDTNQDAQQFNTVILVPIIFSIIIMMSVFNNPDSPLVFWCSLIPFTSPIVMMARLPFDVPVWEVIVSIIILYATFLLTTWLAAKIYRIGIFMHGKKPTWKELGSWLMMK